MVGTSNKSVPEMAIEKKWHGDNLLTKMVLTPLVKAADICDFPFLLDRRQDLGIGKVLPQLNPISLPNFGLSSLLYLYDLYVYIYIYM